MGIKKSTILAGLLVSCISSAQAATSFMVEPYLGYSLLGGLSATTSGTTTQLGSYTGLEVGSRVAVGFDMFFAGADVSYAPSLGYAAPAVASSVTLADAGTTHFKLGAVAGIELPALPLRFWLGYNFIDQLADSSVGGGTTSSGASGSSLKLGAGYKVIPLVSINAEYIMTGLASTSSGGTSTNLPTGTSAGMSSLLISASVPLGL